MIFDWRLSLHLGLAGRTLRLWLCLAAALLPGWQVSGASRECARLRDSCRIATANSDHRDAVRHGGALQRVAEAEGERWYLAQALYYQGVSNVILGNSEIGKSQLDKAFDLAIKEDDDTLCLSVHNGYGVYEANTHANYASAQRHFYKALELAVKIGDPFRQALVECNLAEIASIRGDISGLKYARQCYEWAVANANSHLEFAGAYHCANLYNIAGETDKALIYIRKAEEIAVKENYAEKAALYNLHASICAARGENAEALRWLAKAQGCAPQAQGATLTEICLTYARVYAAMGRLADSDRMITRGLDMSDSLSILSSIPPLLRQRADNFEMRGDCRRALEVYKEYKEVCDSTYADLRERQVNELRVQYDIDRREHEADMHRLRLRDERRKTAILLVSLLSAIGIMAMLWVSYRRQKHLYRNIVIANRDALAREQELLARLDEVASSCGNGIPDTGGVVTNAQKTDGIFDRLRGLMENEEVYRDSGLTREKLAEMLGTNRTYLSQLIADHTGKGYYQFVNGYRIKKAVMILSGAAGSDYPLKALAADLGFKSMSTFYKTFQEGVGMTPSAYRDIAGKL